MTRRTFHSALTFARCHQALCYSCNATKRDRDDTDFRGMALRYGERQANCVFCQIDTSRIVAENHLCFAIRDGHPVSPHHTLLIPKRHVQDFFELYQPELNAVYELLNKMKADVTLIDPQVSGFNVGVNVGQAAGQTVMHAHVHLIPRRQGDVESPRGGVRGVIPDKRHY